MSHKALVFVYPQCIKKGSMAKRFMQLQELSHVTDELHLVEAAQLASAHAVDT